MNYECVQDKELVSNICLNLELSLFGPIAMTVKGREIGSALLKDGDFRKALKAEILKSSLQEWFNSGKWKSRSIKNV